MRRLLSRLSRKFWKFYYKHFEYDRVGERKIKKSIKLWHKGGFFNWCNNKQKGVKHNEEVFNTVRF